MERLVKMIEPLEAWFLDIQRPMPWRDDPTPYHVWVSEIMLQQTRVEAAIPYYNRFIERFPSFEALAGADESEVLKLWQGLGYYSRARNLHKAAKTITEDYNGTVPDDFKTLRKLPGVGDYTAGAILSIAMHKPVAAVDGNVLRVVSRLVGSDRDIMETAVKKDFKAELEKALPHARPRVLNQALMELGALLCLPKNPRCESCPLQNICEAKIKGLTDVLPVKAAPKAKKVEARTVLLLTDGDRVYLRKRPAKGLLAGLWELPGLDGHLTEAEVTAAAESLGFAVKEIRKLKPHVHVFTHIEWHMEGYRVEVKGPGAQELVPAGRKEVEEVYSVPKAFAPFMNVFFEA